MDELGADASRAPRGVEALPDRFNHFAEPVDVQNVQCDVRDEIGQNKPQRKLLLAHKRPLLFLLLIVQPQISRCPGLLDVTILPENAGAKLDVPGPDGSE